MMGTENATFGEINRTFASAANYLSRSGWEGCDRTGRRVTVPADFNVKLLGLKTRKNMSDWQSLGVRRSDGSTCHLEI